MDRRSLAMSRFIDLTGQAFDRLTVLYRVSNAPDGATCFLCQCLCGNQVIVHAAHLRNNHTTSCGCWRKEVLLKGHLTRITHGASRPGHVTPEYNTWCGMLKRCYNLKNKAYPRYGGRGIVVCLAWHDFSQFLTDMGPRPSKSHSIERRNNDGPYSPDNCYWATKKVQSRNTRTNLMLTWNDETHCLIEWAEQLHIPRNTLSMRYRKHWSTERILTQPYQPHKRTQKPTLQLDLSL